jgi:hypothetical protein
MKKSRPPSARKSGTKKARQRASVKQPRRPGSQETEQDAPKDEREIAARMLAVLADPAMLGSSTSDKIRKSGVSKEEWYRYRNDPRFLGRMGRACIEALDECTGSVMEALAESAQAPGRSGHADRRLFLQFVGHDKSAATLREQEQEEEKKPITDAELIAMLMDAHKGREHVLRYVLPNGIRKVIGLDPTVPLEVLSDLQARRGLDPGKCAEYVARIRASVAALQDEERRSGS